MISDRFHLLADEIQKQILRYQTRRDRRIRRLWMVVVSATLLLTSMGLLVSLGGVDLGVFWNLCTLGTCGLSIGFALYHATTESRWLRERTEWVITQLKQLVEDIEMRTREWGPEFAEFEFKTYFERYYSIRFQAFARSPKFKWSPLRLFQTQSI